jgi:hypothetical protein
LKDLPDWDWREISAHFRCTKCGTVGYVDTRMDWTEVIDFNKGISRCVVARGASKEDQACPA